MTPMTESFCHLSVCQAKWFRIIVNLFIPVTTSERIAHRRNKIVLVLKLLPSRPFRWTVGARDLMPERRLAEIIELQLI